MEFKILKILNKTPLECYQSKKKKEPLDITALLPKENVDILDDFKRDREFFFIFYSLKLSLLFVLDFLYFFLSEIT